MLEWALWFIPNDGSGRQLVAGIDVETNQIAKSSHGHLLYGNMAFFKGPNYFDWYADKGYFGEIVYDGEWSLTFYYINPDNKIRKQYPSISLMEENVTYRHREMNTVTRFTHYAEYMFNKNFDIVLNYAKPVDIEQLLQDIIVHYIILPSELTRDDESYYAHVKLWDDIKKALPSYKKEINHFNWRGNGLDMLCHLAKEHNCEYLIIGDTLYFGDVISFGSVSETDKHFNLMTPIDFRQYRISDTFASSDVIGSITPFPGQIAYIFNKKARQVAVNYYCSMDNGATTNCLSMPRGQSITEETLDNMMKDSFTPYFNNKKPEVKKEVGILLAQNKRNEILNFEPDAQNEHEIYKKIYHETYPYHSNLNNYDNFIFTNEDTGSGLGGYITGREIDPYRIRTLRASPFAGNIGDVVAPAENAAWGIQYPHVVSDAELIALVDGHRDKAVSFARMWTTGHVPYRDSEYDYRLTFIDGSTIYEKGLTGDLYTIARNSMKFFTYDKIRSDVDVFELGPPGPSMELTPTQLIIDNDIATITTDKDKIFIGVGNASMEMTQEKIKFKIGTTSVVIDSTGISVGKG